MRSVRSFLYSTGEFIFPEDDSYGALSVFYGILEGLTIRAEDFTLDMGSGCYDESGIEIFERDIVEVPLWEAEEESRETCLVCYEDGYYNLVSEQGWEEGLSCSEEFKIIGHNHKLVEDVNT